MDNATENTVKTSNLQQTLGGHWCIEVYEGKDHRALIYGKTPEETKRLAELFCGAISINYVTAYSTLKAEYERLKVKYSNRPSKEEYLIVSKGCSEYREQTVTLKAENEEKEKRIKELTAKIIEQAEVSLKQKAKIQQLELRITPKQ